MELTKDQDVERKLRELRGTPVSDDLSEHANELFEECLQQYISASCHFDRSPSQNQVVLSRRTRWLGPITAAAAVLTAISIWPDNGGSEGNGRHGRVYAVSDVPDLIASARVLHLKGVYFEVNAVHPEDNLQKSTFEQWFDLENGKEWRRSAHERDPDSLFNLSVSDGHYLMQANPYKPTGGDWQMMVSWSAIDISKAVSTRSLLSPRLESVRYTMVAVPRRGCKTGIEKSWRPAVADRGWASSPVPTAPNATTARKCRLSSADCHHTAIQSDDCQTE